MINRRKAILLAGASAGMLDSPPELELRLEQKVEEGAGGVARGSPNEFM